MHRTALTRRRSSGPDSLKCRSCRTRVARAHDQVDRRTADHALQVGAPGRGTVERGDDRISLKVIFSGRFIFCHGFSAPSRSSAPIFRSERVFQGWDGPEILLECRPCHSRSQRIIHQLAIFPSGIFQVCIDDDLPGQCHCTSPNRRSTLYQPQFSEELRYPL